MIIKIFDNLSHLPCGLSEDVFNSLDCRPLKIQIWQRKLRKCKGRRRRWQGVRHIGWSTSNSGLCVSWWNSVVSSCHRTNWWQKLHEECTPSYHSEVMTVCTVRQMLSWWTQIFSQFLNISDVATKRCICIQCQVANAGFDETGIVEYVTDPWTASQFTNKCHAQIGCFR